MEQQIESAESDRVTVSPASERNADLMRRVQGLRLARRQVLQQLQNASHERHKQMLEAALAELDRKLAIESK